MSREVLLRECPELRDGGRTRAGVPVIVQLLGGEPEHVAESARRAAELGALGIDLNFGCPARKVNGSDGGAALLKTPHRITRVVGEVRDACPPEVTVSAKIRLGWEDPADVVACATAAEAGGAQWITIHGRTKVQMYKPSADWGRIAQARERVRIPVVANGDIFTPADVDRCGTVTGCQAFMLGRGAFRTPNLFRMIRGLDGSPWSHQDQVQFLERFVEQVVGRHDRYENPQRAALNRLKGWVGAMAEVWPEMAEVFAKLKRAQAIDPALALLRAPGAHPSAPQPESDLARAG